MDGVAGKIRILHHEVIEQRVRGTRTPTALPVNVKPWMVTVACESPRSVASTSPEMSKPFWSAPVVMIVLPAPEPMIVSSLLMVAPANVPAPTMMVSPADAASTASWMVA